MGKNNPNANPIWGIERRKPSCLCTDGETYSNECCEGYLWNQGISRTQGTDPSLQNLLTTENPVEQGISPVFILGTTTSGEVFKIIWT